MDLVQKQSVSLDDFFEESIFANKMFITNRQQSEQFSEKDAFQFNIQDSFDHFIKTEQIPLPEPLHPEQCQSLRNNEQGDDTNQFDEGCEEKSQMSEISQSKIPEKQNQNPQFSVQYLSAQSKQIEGLSCEKLEQVVTYLIEHSNLPLEELSKHVGKQFQGILCVGIIKELIEKFSKLKKTKEELIKYCMRKAFKFILQLPKNKHLMEVQKQQKFSFSKCKNRFLKNISGEKSMNNKFLQQIFQEKDFSNDYQLFLNHFEDIMLEDNQKKIKYLSDLLTNPKEGKNKSVQMVRRLPWTKSILDKVRKISKQLLKYSGQK